MSDIDEAALRERAHALLGGEHYPKTCEWHNFNDRAACDRIVASERAHAVERAELRAEVERLQDRANMRFDEGTTYLQHWRDEVSDLRQALEVEKAGHAVTARTLIEATDEVAGLKQACDAEQEARERALADVARLTKERDEAAERCRALETLLREVLYIHARYVDAENRSPEEDEALNAFDDVCCDEIIPLVGLTPSIPGGGT